MKLGNLTFLIFMLCCLCAPQEKSDSTTIPFPERAKDMVIYEVNVRQYTPEGTLNAFSKHLPRLQGMGIDILWIMPIQPIGQKNRKGTLGSYYSIKDYVAVNREFGTLDDFKNLVDQAHDLGMLVILDWVANHTAWDHEWIKKDGYHTKDSAGNIISPVPDWSDVADLNYDNTDMQNEMITALKYWVKEADIDGFRCDMAGMVPIDFWNRAKDSLDTSKDVFMLAEWDEPKMHSAFHMTYDWELHHLMNGVAKGEKSVDLLMKSAVEDTEKYGQDAFRLHFLTNHDENSWAGTVFERLGDGHKAYAVLAFTMQGMPLIYSGQEAGLDKRLAFFEKDEIDWGDIKYQDFYTQLVQLKTSNEALFNGEYGGQPQFINSGNPKVISFTRSKGDNEVAVVINLSEEDQSIAMDESFGDFKDYFTGKPLDASIRSLSPYQYYVGTKERAE